MAVVTIKVDAASSEKQTVAVFPALRALKYPRFVTVQAFWLTTAGTVTSAKFEARAFSKQLQNP